MGVINYRTMFEFDSEYPEFVYVTGTILGKGMRKGVNNFLNSFNVEHPLATYSIFIPATAT